MNSAFNKDNFIYIVIKSFVLAIFMTLFENWQNNNLIFNFSMDEFISFVIRFLVSLFVLLIIEIIRQKEL